MHEVVRQRIGQVSGMPEQVAVDGAVCVCVPLDAVLDAGGNGDVAVVAGLAVLEGARRPKVPIRRLRKAGWRWWTDGYPLSPPARAGEMSGEFRCYPRFAQ